MSNMFSNKDRKYIPRTLADCIQPDGTVIHLHGWAERIESWGKTLFGILIVIGILITIVATIVAARVGDGMGFTVFIISAISWGISAFIEYLAYHAIALLISALASITQNTAISANVALYEASKDEPQQVIQPYAAFGDGISPAQNIPYGQYAAPKAQYAAPQPQVAPQIKKWHPVAESTVQQVGSTNIKCTNCGRVQFSGNKTCSRCGARFTGFEY